jgi:hypothetical protein
MPKTISENNDVDEVLSSVPVEFFLYCGSAKKEGNSMYRCLMLNGIEWKESFMQ